MKREEFDNMEIVERINYVGYNGDYIALREYKDCLVGLYIINGFFVEVHYYKGLKVNRIESVTEDEIIPLYLDDLDLSELFS